MTIFDASTKLFGWYKEHDSFILSEDFSALVLISEEEERDSAAVLAALKQLEKIELIKKENYHDKEVWLLNKPFSQFEQSVEISPVLASAIAETINDFCDMIEDDTDRCDCTDITDRDIRNLILMYEQAKSLAQEKMKDDLT